MAPSSEVRITLSVARLGLLAVCVLALAGCGGQPANIPPSPAQTVRFGHVFIVVEENANYADVIANPSMPYLNSLANQYGLATNYFANAHPSSPDYFELTTGQTLAPLSLTDLVTPHNFPVDADNVVRELLAAAKPGSLMPKIFHRSATPGTTPVATPSTIIRSPISPTSKTKCQSKRKISCPLLNSPPI